MKTRHSATTILMLFLIAGSLVPCCGQDQGTLTEKEKNIERQLNPTLHYALDTLSGKHSLSEAQQVLKKCASTNELLTVHLLELSKCENDGVRNLALWCLEVAFPDDKAVWKRIIQDGQVVAGSSLKIGAMTLGFMAQVGKLTANAGTDLHMPDFDSKPAMKVSEFIKLYGKPDRKRTLLGTRGRDYKWMFYGPIGVKINDAESDVLANQLSMSTIMWSGACKAFEQDFSWPGKNAVPDMSSVFLNIQSPKK